MTGREAAPTARSGGDVVTNYSGPEDLERFSCDLRRWLDANTEPPAASVTQLADDVLRTRSLQHKLYEADWVRWGWPEAVGGLGGTSLFRAVVAEEIVSRGLVPPTPFSTTEVLGIPVAELGGHSGVLQYVPALVSGREGWCQGFSEPESGSDLASLRCRATDHGDHYVVSGQKIWTSFASFASRCVTLVRTGSPELRHRTITALLVDMDSSGLHYRPIEGIDGQQSFAEVFFDDVIVPKSRVIGRENRGWAVAMRILECERGSIFWLRSAWLIKRLQEFVAEGAIEADDASLGSVFAAIVSLRARSWQTQHRLARGTFPPAEASIDKVLMATAEQSLFDLVHDSTDGRLEFGTDPVTRAWRQQYMYSLAASIYGGSSEIQRNIIAEHALGLPREAS